MTGRERVVGVPLIPPWAAYVIDRDFGKEIEAKARSMASTQPVVSKQLQVAVEQLREIARQVGEAGFGSAVQAGDGSSEVPDSGEASESCSPPRCPPGLTIRQVATRLERSERQVRNLIEQKRLVATGRGRGRRVDEVSVAMELERRRSAARDRSS